MTSVVTEGRSDGNKTDSITSNFPMNDLSVCKLPKGGDGEENPKSREVISSPRVRYWCEWGTRVTGMGDFDDCVSQIGGEFVKCPLPPHKCALPSCQCSYFAQRYPIYRHNRTLSFGGDFESGTARFARHEPLGQTSSLAACAVADAEEEALRRAKVKQRELGFPGDMDAWHNIVEESRQELRNERSEACLNAPVAVVLENKFLAITVTPSLGIETVKDKESGEEFSFTHELFTYDVQHGDAYGFSPNGPAKPVLNGSANILASTAVLGDVTQEVWLQVASEFKTRIRIWISDDPQVGRRIEIGHKIGVLAPLTDVLSRFTMPALNASDAVFFSEDNGYEKIPHAAGTDEGNIATHLYPSQASVALATQKLQLSIALDRSHAVGSLAPASIDVVLHRRGTPYEGTGGTVVLDDTDRIWTETWIALGEKTQSNRDRVSMKLRLNHPLQIFYGRPKVASKVTVRGSLAKKVQQKYGSSFSMGQLPQALHLQAVRALGPEPKRDGFLARLRSMFSRTEDAELSKPQVVDVFRLFDGLSDVPKQAQEVTLSGIMPRSQLHRFRFPTGEVDSHEVGSGASSESVTTNVEETIASFELRTWILSW